MPSADLPAEVDLEDFQAALVACRERLDTAISAVLEARLELLRVGVPAGHHLTDALDDIAALGARRRAVLVALHSAMPAVIERRRQAPPS